MATRLAPVFPIGPAGMGCVSLQRLQAPTAINPTPRIHEVAEVTASDMDVCVPAHQHRSVANAERLKVASLYLH